MQEMKFRIITQLVNDPTLSLFLGSMRYQCCIYFTGVTQVTSTTSGPIEHGLGMDHVVFFKQLMLLAF